MTIDTFVKVNELRALDAIVLKKKFLGMVDHYALYMGVHEGKHVFVANYTKGIQVVPPQELIKFLTNLIPSEIIRFMGTGEEWKAAWNRAVSRIGEKAYDYFHNNCEHFVSWVHRGEHTSQQVENFKEGVKITGTIAIGGLLIY